MTAHAFQAAVLLKSLQLEEVGHLVLAKSALVPDMLQNFHLDLAGGADILQAATFPFPV